MTPAPLPQRIGRYELLEFLGGGMSHVYRARDTTIGRAVALKILTPEGCADQDVRERFLQEARMAGNVSHENIINVYDYGEAEGRPFLVMEFLQGEDLGTLIREQRTGNTQGKLRIALKVARALEYVHEQKIVHRDIKPDNVRVTALGAVKLMDFGIAKVEGLARTQAGFVLGTPYYMAPEQVRGEQITPLVDVYAFGILLYEMFAGVRPFRVDELVQIFNCILNVPIDVAPLRQAGTPEEVIRLIERTTAKDPAVRPQSAAAIVQEIENLLGAYEARTTPAPMPAMQPTVVSPAAITRKRPLGLWIGIGGALAVVVAAVAFLALRDKHATVTPQAAAAVSQPVTRTTPAKLALPSGDMLLVPAGDALLGEKKEPVSTHAFYIDQTEVSNRAYAEYGKQTGTAMPGSIGSADRDKPVVNVSFEDAANFAKWAGKRLPTGAEWERSARGTDGRLFPWGDQYAKGRANLDGNSLARVHSFDAGAGPSGALNLFGNVWEWVDQRATPSADDVREIARGLKNIKPALSLTEPYYFIRGGSYKWDAPKEMWSHLMWDGIVFPAWAKAPDVGFRCAMDVPK